MQNKYWKDFYKTAEVLPPSSFAEWSAPLMKSEVVELGCGNGRDLRYFLEKGIKATGVDSAFGEDVEEYIKKHKSPEYVYTRFFWHSINRELQKKILKWTKSYIFIEARTTEDRDRPKVFGDHTRHFVHIGNLLTDLYKNGFVIVEFKEGTGLSPFKDEDPYLVRVFAKKI